MSSPVSRSGRMPRCFSNPLHHWALALVILILLALFMTEYHRWRGRPWSFFSFNKGLSIAATLMLAWACCQGPLHRLGLAGVRVLRFRRPVALAAAFGAATHILMVFTVLWDRFGWAWVVEEPLSALLGLTAALALFSLSVTSWPWAPRRMGMPAWLLLHSTARWILLVTALHYLALGKAANWVKWLQTLDHPVPPGTVVPTVGISIALAIAAISRRRAKSQGPAG